VFKQLYLCKEPFAFYFSPLQEYVFALKGKKTNGTSVEYLISCKQNKQFTVSGFVDNKQYYEEDLTEDHTLIQTFSKTIGFKQMMAHKRIFEKRMKEQLQLDNIYLEGKIDHETFIISFQIKSPVLQDSRVNLKPGTDETDYFQILSDQQFFYIAIRKFGNKFVPIYDIKVDILLPQDNSARPNVHLPSFEKWRPLRKSFYTHQNFMEDISNILLNDPRIRVKLLVN